MWGLEDQQGRPHLARCPARPDPVHTHTCSVQMHSYVPSSAGVSRQQPEGGSADRHAWSTHQLPCAVCLPTVPCSPAPRHGPKQCAEACTHTFTHVHAHVGYKALPAQLHTGPRPPRPRARMSNNLTGPDQLGTREPTRRYRPGHVHVLTHVRESSWSRPQTSVHVSLHP